ncbi:MAG TPA: hypothetical protein VFK52_02785 [Nocardioidaceae bacterium]|nr:hypothetical protein [Nocardioidaceae bacterium]
MGEDTGDNAGDSGGDRESREGEPVPFVASFEVTPVAERSHALHVFTARAHARLDELGSVLTSTMTETARAETAAEAIRLQDRLAGLVTLLVADDPTVVAAVRSRTRITAQTARRIK